MALRNAFELISTEAKQDDIIAAIELLEPLTDAQLRADPVNVSPLSAEIIPVSITTSSSGTTTLITPSSGASIRLYWFGLAGNPGNTDTVIASLRWTAGGQDFLAVPLSKYGGMFAHSYGGGNSYVQGEVDEALILNLNAAQTVTANLDYQEIL